MKQLDEVKVTIKISGFRCSPEKISELLGIEATKQWKKGDIIDPRMKRRRENNGWMLESGLASDTTVDQQVKVLAEIFLPIKERFLALPKETMVAVNCVVYSTHGRPDISLPSDLVKAIGEIDADLDFDLYQLPSDE